MDKVCKSQYCILNKSFSVQFWSCQSNLMERGRLLRALCSKYSVFGHQHSHSGERYVLILNQIGSFRKFIGENFVPTPNVPNIFFSLFLLTLILTPVNCSNIFLFHSAHSLEHGPDILQNRFVKSTGVH